MKQSILLTFLLLFSLPPILIGQSNQIKQLEDELKQLDGNAFLNKSFELAEIYLKNGHYDDGVKVLDKASREVKKMKRGPQIAFIHKEKASYILRLAPPDKKYLQTAFESIKTSLQKNIPALEDGNLNLLETIKSRSTDRKLSISVNNEIAEINSKRESLAIQTEKTKQEEEFKEFKKRGKDQKFEEFKNIQSERKKLESTVSTLAQQRRDLDRLNQERKLQIDELSTEQAKSQLLLLETKKNLDSLKYLALSDSIDNVQKTAELERVESKLELQTAQLKLTKTRNNLFIALAGFIALLSIFLFMRYRSSRKHNAELENKNKIIDTEKSISENLLLNILSESIASELKEKGTVETQSYESCTVMFADFVNFSKISKTMSPQKLIESLHHCFGKFDEIVEKHGVEKIKTIGDAYMCAAGVPTASKKHASNIIDTAKEFQTFLRQWNTERSKLGLPLFEARIGIHSGPVIAGVVGNTKFAFDIWGDTVNTAGRMETTSEPGRINIS